MGDLQVDQLVLHADIVQPLADRLGHGSGGLPHGVVDDQRLAVALLVAPAAVGLDDPARVAAPDHPVVRGEHADGQLHLLDLGEQFLDQRRVKIEDVGIVLGGLVHEHTLFDLVVEPLAGGQVFAEGVAGEQDLVLLEVGEHGVRPVEHARFQETQGPLAQADLLPAADHVVGPVGLVEMLQQGLVPHLRADDLLRADGLDDLGQTAGVVHLHVVDHQVVDLLRVDDIADAVQQFALVGLLHRVDEGDFFIDDEKGVVGGAVDRIAVKVAADPVDSPDPVDVLGKCNLLHGSGLQDAGRG